MIKNLKVPELKRIPGGAGPPTDDTGFSVWQGHFYMGANQHGYFIRERPDAGHTRVWYDDVREPDLE